jgi:hypothetical protein
MSWESVIFADMDHAIPRNSCLRKVSCGSLYRVSQVEEVIDVGFQVFTAVVMKSIIF